MACRHFRTKFCFSSIRRLGQRKLSTDQVAVFELDETIRGNIESEELKPRKHPGVMKLGTCTLPKHIVNAIGFAAEDHPVKHILNDAKTLANYLFSRHYPWEEEDLMERKSGFVKDVKSRLGDLSEDASEELVVHYHKLVKASVSHLMTKYCYQWSALDLQDYSCMVYLFTRAAPNYAAVMRAFLEITKAYPDYRPTSLFDFGSGIGSVSWAAKECWGTSLKEYMNIDSSGSMNELASRLLSGGASEAETPPGFHFRQFLPARHTKYSLVVSAHSLMELPSRDARLELLLNLWHKTEHFLVIVEQGTKPCFKVVVEARDFILSLSNEESPAHILAPCPHDGTCPRFLRGPYPCHFRVSYFDLGVGKKQEIKKELLSYVIIRKGRRKEDVEWPRVVRPVLKRHNHVICRLCTARGDLHEEIFTKKKHGKVLYKCAKVTSWGDRLPVNLSLPQNSESEISPQDKTITDDTKPD